MSDNKGMSDDEGTGVKQKNDKIGMLDDERTGQK